MDAVADEPNEFDAVTIRENRNGTQRQYDGLVIKKKPNQYEIYNVERQRNQLIRKNDPNITVTRTQWPGYNPSRGYNAFRSGVGLCSERFSDGRISDRLYPCEQMIGELRSLPFLDERALQAIDMLQWMRMNAEIARRSIRTQDYVPWIDEALRRRVGLTCRMCGMTFNTYDELIDHEMSDHSCNSPYQAGYPLPLPNFRNLNQS